MRAAGDWSIRRLQSADLEAYKGLRDRSLAEHPTAFSSDTSEALSRNAASYRSRLGEDRPEGGQFILGAFDRSDHRLLGALSCEREQRIKLRHIGHLTAMMVRSDCAGRGIGRALLQAVIAAARATPGLEMLTLSVTATNLVAVTLYERAGFVRWGSLPDAIKVDGAGHIKDQMLLRL